MHLSRTHQRLRKLRRYRQILAKIMFSGFGQASEALPRRLFCCLAVGESVVARLLNLFNLEDLGLRLYAYGGLRGVLRACVATTG